MGRKGCVKILAGAVGQLFFQICLRGRHVPFNGKDGGAFDPELSLLGDSGNAVGLRPDLYGKLNAAGDGAVHADGFGGGMEGEGGILFRFPEKGEGSGEGGVACKPAAEGVSLAVDEGLAF